MNELKPIKEGKVREIYDNGDSLIMVATDRISCFDVILNNIDRHNENIGVLRDKNSGEIISLAPNYDDNLSLIARDASLPLSSEEGFLKQFVKLIMTNKEIKQALPL